MKRKLQNRRFLTSAKKEEPNFLGQKYLICIFYMDYRKFGANFSSVENSDYWMSPKCVRAVALKKYFS
jgi:hypothetical protein